VGPSVCPCIVATQRLDEHVPAQREIFRGVICYAVHVISKENRRLVLLITCYFNGVLTEFHLTHYINIMLHTIRCQRYNQIFIADI
jgi:hypothetical protein